MCGSDAKADRARRGQLSFVVERGPKVWGALSGFGGSSHAWLGKSTVFNDIDFAEREWVPYSGWPFERETLAPHIDRAAEMLNLGPNCYNDRLCELIGLAPLTPELDPKVLKSWFWQFARSRINHRDILRLGPEFITFHAPKVRVLLNATVTRINRIPPVRRSRGSKSQTSTVTT
jgi:hypothetical protein